MPLEPGLLNLEFDAETIREPSSYLAKDYIASQRRCHVKYSVLTGRAFHLITHSLVQLVPLTWQASVPWSGTITSSYSMLSTVATGFITSIP